MIVSKQALSYMKIRDVALLFKVSTDPNLFLQKKRRITGSLQFCIVSSCIFSLSCLAYFTAVKSQRSCMNTSKSKNCQVGTSFVLQSLSLSPCHTIYLAIIPICFDLGIFLIVPVTYLQVVNALAPGLSEVHTCAK